MELEIPADASWRHQWTDLAAPPELSGFNRDSIQEIEANQLNIMALYFDRSSKSLAAIYVFRPGLADVSIWSERAIQSLRSAPEFGSTGLSDEVAGNFTPKSGGGANSGYVVYGELVGGEGKSAGVAVFPHDGWLVKVHMSSAALTKDELAQRLNAFVSALDMQPAAVEYPRAYGIADCAEPISFARNARRARPDSSQLLIMTAMAPQMRIRTDKDGKPITPIAPSHYCRDQSSTATYGVYRADGTEDAYVVAYGDAGSTMTVGKSDLASLLGGRNDYWLMLGESARVSIYDPFVRLPSPDIAIAAVQGEEPIGAAQDPPGGDPVIIFSEAALGK